MIAGEEEGLGSGGWGLVRFFLQVDWICVGASEARHGLEARRIKQGGKKYLCAHLKLTQGA
jgi:hypothetical protein